MGILNANSLCKVLSLLNIRSLDKPFLLPQIPARATICNGGRTTGKESLLLPWFSGIGTPQYSLSVSLTVLFNWKLFQKISKQAFDDK